MKEKNKTFCTVYDFYIYPRLNIPDILIQINNTTSFFVILDGLKNQYVSTIYDFIYAIIYN